MELLLPTAAKKLDLSFNIEREVPAWVYADYARIRQGILAAFLQKRCLTSVFSSYEPNRERS